MNPWEEHHLWLETLGKQGKRISCDEDDFHGQSFTDWSFESGYFAACDFHDSVFRKADFYCGKFYSCDFTNAFFEDCEFRKAVLNFSNFNGATFVNCRFSRAEAQEAFFNQCTFKDCVFGNVGIMNSEMVDAAFEDVDFDGAYFSQVSFPNARFIRPKNIEGICSITGYISKEKDPELIGDAELRRWIVKQASSTT